MSEIRKMRKKLNMRADELASAVGISVMSVYRYEQGCRKPDIEVAARMAKVFRCNIEDLLDKGA